MIGPLVDKWVIKLKMAVGRLTSKYIAWFLREKGWSYFGIGDYQSRPVDFDIRCWFASVYNMPVDA